jgi:hypothetical protein
MRAYHRAHQYPILYLSTEDQLKCWLILGILTQTLIYYINYLSFPVIRPSHSLHLTYQSNDSGSALILFVSANVYYLAVPTSGTIHPSVRIDQSSPSSIYRHLSVPMRAYAYT